MRFCSVASGSSGNCIFAGSDHTSVLVDAGLSGKRIEAGLNGISMSLKDIDALLVTHEHSDHVKGIGVLARRYGIPIYATKGTAEMIAGQTTIGKIPDGLMHIIETDRDFVIGDLCIRPFHISHDAKEPCGYRIGCGGKTAAVATDMGCYDSYIEEQLRDIDVLLLESNHDIRMLEAGRYPYYLKRRILSEHGHLSNLDAGQLLCHVLHDGTKHVFLGHLSQENNYEELAYETVCTEITMGDCPYKAGDFSISVAHRDMPGEEIIW